jgi:aminodeoxyfutalosine synthase
MSTLPTFDTLNEHVSAGERLNDADLLEISRTSDILQIGMLADVARRRLNGTRVTYLRVVSRPWDQEGGESIPPAAREVRLTGSPASLAVALTAIERTKLVAGDRTVSAFSWDDVVRLASSDGASVANVLAGLRDAGLDALVEVPLDTEGGVEAALEGLRAAGFRQIRLTVERAPAVERTTLMIQAAGLQEQYRCIQALSPLPSVLQPFRPTTGYEDVRGVAVARLAAPNIPMIQVDWLRYGPKLAQVALTFGADDLDAVSGSDDAPEGARRAPIEELRRNIIAAGLIPAERDGQFSLLP